MTNRIYEISTAPQAVLATMVRYIEQSEEPSQVLLIDLPKNASNTLLNAILKIDTCIDEHDAVLNNSDATINDLIYPFLEQAGVVEDRHEYCYGVDCIVPVTDEQLDAIYKISSISLIHHVSMENTLYQAFNFLHKFKDDLADLSVAGSDSHPDCDRISRLDLLERKNKDVHAVLTLLIGYINDGIEFFNEIKTIEADLAKI